MVYFKVFSLPLFFSSLNMMLGVPCWSLFIICLFAWCFVFTLPSILWASCCLRVFLVNFRMTCSLSMQILFLPLYLLLIFQLRVGNTFKNCPTVFECPLFLTFQFGKLSLTYLQTHWFLLQTFKPTDETIEGFFTSFTVFLISTISFLFFLGIPFPFLCNPSIHACYKLDSFTH